jgi:predicted DNA-binding transcriptional regulator AlpA
MSSNDLMTVTEVAGLIRVPVSWVYARTCPQSVKGDRSIPFLRLGRHLRFRRSEIEKWVEGHHSGVKPSGRQPNDHSQTTVSARLV